MNFDNMPPRWDEQGSEPTQELQENGFTAGYKPPASYFNYLFNKITACIKEIQNKLSSTDDKASAIETNRKIKSYTTLSEIGVTFATESIDTIAANMPDDSELLITVGTNNAAIYPTEYGTLHVIKKDGSRIVFKFDSKTTAYEYIGVYDGTMTNKWTGWHYMLTETDIVDTLTSTATKLPLSAKQGKALKDNQDSHMINDHKIKFYVSLGDIGVNSANESIEAIAVNMPENSCMLTSITTSNNSALYPQNYGVLHVWKKDTSRTIFIFYEKTVANMYMGVYDDTRDTKWSGWERFARHTDLTKENVGLGNVPNVATNDQTPTYSDTTTLATLSSGEKLNVALQKIKCAITNLINHIESHRVANYVSFGEIGISLGSETIELITTSMPSNSTFLTSIGSSNAAIYPQTYGVLQVTKKDTSRVIFEFWAKSTTAKWIGFYDDSTTAKWTGWKRDLTQSDIVDNALSTAADLPPSANQVKILNDKINGMNFRVVSQATYDAMKTEQRAGTVWFTY